MEKIGVAAVVEGLSSFLSDMGKVDSSIQSVVPTSKLLGGAFDWLGGVISNFVSGAARVLEYTLGGLIKDAIEAVISAIRELIGEIITAGSEFQTLSIRLTGLNLPENAADITNWSAAMADATEKTKEQLDWIQTLSTATPFDSTDVATTYSLARSYGFADEEARRLTEDITSFVAGMGLGSEVIERVILNFGQMVQRGKITGTEIRDLARGAFLPLNDVLQRVAKSMGITIEELTKQISTPEGVPAQIFIDAFQEMIETEPRFVGAAGRLARAFEPAINNVKDLFRNIGGLNIVAPVLDVLGEHVAKLVDEFVTFNDQGDLIKTQKWVDLQNAAKGVGEALSGLIADIINILIPNTSGMADGMIAGLKSISTWITENKPEILAGIQEIKDWIFGTEEKKGAIQNFFDWLGSEEVQGVVTATKNLLQGLKDDLFGVSNGREGDNSQGMLKTMYDLLLAMAPVVEPLIGLFDAIGRTIATAFGGTETTTFAQFITETLVPTINDLTTFINENRDSIAFLLGLWIKGAVIGVAFAATLSFIGSVFLELAATIFGWAAMTEARYSLWVATTIMKIVTWAVNTRTAVADWAAGFLTAIGNWASSTMARFVKWASDTYNTIRNSLRNMDWFAIGADIIQGIISGFLSKTLPSISAPTVSTSGTTTHATGTHGIKTVPPGFNNDNFMVGMQSGEKYMVIPKGGQMSSTMAGSTVNSSQQIINNLTLQINSSAKTEPIVSDFNMLKSMIGA